MRRRVCFGLLLLSSACTRVPADVSSPEGEATAASPSGKARASEEPISSDCKSAELITCTDSCHDSACLEWCAGESCVATIVSLESCMAEAEDRFAAEQPPPPVEYETITDDAGESYNQPTGESVERQYEWEAAHDSALSEHWTTTCESTCSARVAAPSDDGPSFCADWSSSYYAWGRLTQPPPEPKSFGLLNMGAVSMFGALSFGSTIWLEGELAQSADPHVSALMYMLSRAGRELQDAESCVPDLDQNGREFSLALQLDPNGAVRAADVRDEQSETGDCVANVVASTLTLPVRVARDYPQLDVRVLVKPVPNFGGFDYGLEGLGEADNYDWGDIGNTAEETSGWGLRGSGAGGGGGYGGGGYGGGGGSIDVGDIEPPEPPDESEGD
jgi:hypothetical protein